jgi:hypothetical protein
LIGHSSSGVEHSIRNRAVVGSNPTCGSPHHPIASCRFPLLPEVLQEHHRSRKTEPAKTLDQSLPGDLPDAVVAAIRIGYRRLSADAQRVLAAASILGDRVPAARLAGALRLPEATVYEALDELEWQRWLVSEPRGYGFVARIVRQVIERDMLMPGQRRRLLENDAG